MESLIRGGHEEPVQSQHADEIKALRSKIQHSINNDVQIRRTDDDFFLLFLRACDFNVNASFELWCNYNQFRARNCDIYENLSAWQLHHVIEDGCPCVLPYSNQNGAKFMVIFAGCWDTESYGKADILTALILSMERLIEDSEAQRSGIIVITDFSGWTASHASQLSVSFIRQICCMFQVSLPAGRPVFIDLLTRSMTAFVSKGTSQPIEQLSFCKEVKKGFENSSLGFSQFFILTLFL